MSLTLLLQCESSHRQDLNEQEWPCPYMALFTKPGIVCLPTPPPPITFPTYHLIVGGVAGFPGHFGFLLSGFLRVRKEVNLDIGVGIIPILEQLLQRECKAKPSICLCVTIPVVTPWASLSSPTPSFLQCTIIYVSQPAYCILPETPTMVTLDVLLKH